MSELENKMNFMLKWCSHATMVLIFGALSALSDAADNVAINFTGKIIAPSCEVSSSEQNVSLGDIVKSNFSNAGDVSAAIPFSLIINCPTVAPEKATVIFSGTAASDTNLLALDGDSSSAVGVAVRINESDGITQISLNKPSSETTLVSGINTLHYSAQYQALSSISGITSGSANATAQFSINYQ